MKIPGLSHFILCELPQRSNSSGRSAGLQAKIEVDWLFPQELQAIQRLDEGDHDWAEGI